MAKIRQEINILDALLSAAGGASATSNEIVQLDTTQFNGATYYFEIVADSTISISFNVTLRRKGTSTDDATCNVPLLTTAFTLIRSSSFTPPAGATEYVVFIDATAGATKNVKAARIIILQDAAQIYTETQIEIGTKTTTTSTTLVSTNPKYWKYVSADWSTPLTVYWEITMACASSKSATTAQLQVADGTGDGFVNWAAVGSDLTTTSTTPARVRSAAITLTAGRNYRVVFKSGTSKSAASQYNAKIIIQQSSWSLVGSGLTISGAFTGALAALSSTRVALFDPNNLLLKAYDFDGSNWSLVGSGLTISGAAVPALAALSSTRVALFDDGNDSLRAYDFDGSNWSLVGSGLTISGAANPALAALSSTRVAFCDGSNDSLRAYDFDGSNWSLVGSGLTISGSVNPALAALSSTRVAFFDSGNDSLRAYDFDGSNWSLVGSGLTISVSNFTALAALSSTQVAFINNDGNVLDRYDFDGANWSLVGFGTVILSAGVPTIAALSSTRVAFFDSSNISLRAYDFSNGVAAFAPQYLQANAPFAAGTGLQTFLTKWDSTEWSNFRTVFKFAVDAANGSTSVVEADTAAGTQITGSVVTSPDNQGISSAMTMPADGNLDCKATTNNGDIYSSRILVLASTVFLDWHTQAHRPPMKREIVSFS